MTYKKLAIIFFILNGCASLIMKATSEIRSAAAIPMMILTINVVGTGIAAFNPSVREPLQRKTVLVGIIAGISSAVGIAAMCKASAIIPAHTAFPMTSGGLILLVTIASMVGFKEKIGPYGFAGVTLAVAALWLLRP